MPLVTSEEKKSVGSPAAASRSAASCTATYCDTGCKEKVGDELDAQPPTRV